MLRTLLVPPADDAERGWYAARDTDTEGIRSNFRSNLEAIVEAAEGVPLFLATLPVHLRYDGFEMEPDPDAAPTAATSGVRHPLTDPRFRGVPPCRGGVALFEAGARTEAAPLLRQCLADPSPHHDPRRVGAYLALATPGGDLEELGSACLAAGARAVRAEDAAGAIAALTECDGEPADVLRWMGEARRLEGDVVEARRLLTQSVELAPRNRCAPSFNAAIREVAEADGVALIDLEAAAIAATRDGLPGSELFLDSCHMTWGGYALMARTVVETMAATLADVPDGEHVPMEEIQSSFELPDAEDRVENVLLGLRREGAIRR